VEACTLTAVDIRWTLAPAPDVPHDSDDLVADAIIDAQSYRLVAQQAIGALAEREAEVRRLRQRIDALRDECRRYARGAVGG
jgi:predicted trehalose synthase